VLGAPVPCLGTMNAGAGAESITPKEALWGHGGTSELAGGAGTLATPRPALASSYADRESGELSSSNRSSAARGTSIRRPMRQTGSSPRCAAS
jgi:hypothetical protein